MPTLEDFDRGASDSASKESKPREPLGVWTRFVGVVVAPKLVFADLRDRPQWLPPVLLFVFVQTALFLTTLATLRATGVVTATDIPWSSILELPLLASIAVSVPLFLVHVVVTGCCLAMSFRLVGRPVAVSHATAVVSYSAVPAILVLPLINLLASVVASLRTLRPEFVQASQLSATQFLDALPEGSLASAVASTVNIVDAWLWPLKAIGISIVGTRISFGLALAVIVPVSVVIDAGLALAHWSFNRHLIRQLLEAVTAP